jgi:hypothetical protein
MVINSAGCAFVFKRGFYQLNGPGSARITLLSDSPEARRLLTEEDAREAETNRSYRELHTEQERTHHIEDMLQHPDQYPAGRKDFIRSMSQLPGISVPGFSYCDLIERSKSRCGPSPIDTAAYVLVQVTTGPSKGERGWMCESSGRRVFP